MENNKIKLLIISILIIFSMQFSFATLKIDQIQFDPAIITAGDNVDIIVQFRDNSSSFITKDKLGNPEYKFKVSLESNDDLTKKYITIVDSVGDNLFGTIYSGQVYNKKFRIKVEPLAPASNYQFKLVGQWYKNGFPEELTEEMTFLMNVKKEGILLEIPTITTVPAQIRPGDKFVEIKTFIENLGLKDARSIKISLNLPEGISNSYSNNNDLWIGTLNGGTSRNISFFVNLEDNLEAKVYNLNYSLNYFDIDNNPYSKEKSIAFLVKPKANLVVEEVIGSGLAGDNGQLKVRIKNIGGQTAENIDVRILKENSQPFQLDIRSDYIGQLKPNESGVAIFNFKINSDAQIKNHDFKLILRAKGDSNEGDDTIYTYTRRAQFDVVGTAKNYYLIFGFSALALFLIYLLFTKLGGKKKK